MLIADARQNKCLAEMTASYPFMRLDSLIAGEPVLQRADWLARWRDDRSGQGVPSMPTLLYHGRIDEVVPYSQGRQLFADWCAHGAPVEFRTVDDADHFAGYALGSGPAMDWMSRRFAGAEARSDCPPGSPTASPAPAPRMRLSVTPRRARAGRTTAYRFRVRSSSADCVRGVSIRFAGRRVRTDRRGRAALRIRVVRRGLRRAVATKRRCARAHAAVRIR